MIKWLRQFALLIGICVLTGCAAAPVVPPAPPQIGDTLVIEAQDWRTGEPVDLGQLRGRVTLVELWATWCKPCAKAMVHHGDLYKRLQTKGFRVLAVSLDEDREALLAFLSAHAVPFAVAWDQGQRTGDRLRPAHLPVSYVLDSEGKILAIAVGGDEVALRTIADTVEGLLERP